MRESMREELTDDDLVALGRGPQPRERPTPQASTLERANMLMAQAVETAELRTRERDDALRRLEKAQRRIDQLTRTIETLNPDLTDYIER
jgi:hypothetical protein